MTLTFSFVFFVSPSIPVLTKLKFGLIDRTQLRHGTGKIFTLFITLLIFGFIYLTSFNILATLNLIIKGNQVNKAGNYKYLEGCEELLFLGLV
jgi:hypothetical protein